MAMIKVLNKKIDLALLYRRFNIGGVTGSVLIEYLLSPAMCIDLSYEEALILVCDIAGVSYLAGRAFLIFNSIHSCFTVNILLAYYVVFLVILFSFLLFYHYLILFLPLSTPFFTCIF